VTVASAVSSPLVIDCATHPDRVLLIPNFTTVPPKPSFFPQREVQDAELSAEFVAGLVAQLEQLPQGRF
jgi:hypothetical protein